jgi:hypothetical protein
MNLKQIKTALSKKTPASTYKTQSLDTSIEAELVQFQLWRNLTPTKKEALAKRVIQRVPKLVLMEIKNRFSDAGETEIRRQYIIKRWGEKWAKILSTDSQIKLMLEDPIWLARRVAVILESLDIDYYVCGSVASSLQGEIRYTQDLDLVIKIEPVKAELLIEAMAGEFYISEVAVEEALSGKTSSFNVIHLETTEKADLFVMGEDEFSRIQMTRRRLHVVEENRSFYLSSPEDTVLHKLIWFGMTGGESQKQWRDILGVLKLQGESLDVGYMREWGEKLGLERELNRAFGEAGFS